MSRRYMGTTSVQATNGGGPSGGYNILPMPVLQAPPPASNGTATPPVVPTPAANPLDGIMGMLDGEVMGIPIKYIAIGLAAYFLMKK